MKIINKIFTIGENIADARAIKKDPEKRPKCKKFGAKSIVYSIFAVGFIALFILGINWISSGNVGNIVIGFIFAIIGAICTLSCLINSIGHCILQISVNRKAISWIALLILLIGLAAAAIIALKILGIL